jgi:hypothetical protein
MALAFAPAALAASFIVPTDQHLAQQSSAIVVATALASHTERNAKDVLETVTTMSVEEVVKGSVTGDTIDLYEPGGADDKGALLLPGSPRFRDGDRYILFLTRSDGRWHAQDLTLGKFTIETDLLGRKLAVRDVQELDTSEATRPEERDADAFLLFLRTAVKGGPARTEYFVPVDPADRAVQPGPTAERLRKLVNVAGFTAASYTFFAFNNLGSRWTVFPSAVSFFSRGTEPGAPGGGVTAINAAFASWNGEANSNVNYVYAGADNGTHNGGTNVSDGANTISFEQDLSSAGVGPFFCSGNSYSGVLGMGGVTKTQGTHTGPDNGTFNTAIEGDVSMNKGIANCTLLFNNGDFNSAVTHEVGHTLGFRHSDQTRADDPNTPCSSDPSLECTSNAIMNSFIPTGLNAVLRTWDIHAVQSVYPGSGGGGTVPTAPVGVNARATSTGSVTISWFAVSGATSYDVYRRGAGTSFALIGNTASTSFVDSGVAANTAYLYQVFAKNSAGTSPGSIGDWATTVIYTDEPLVVGVTVVKSTHLAQLRTAANAVRALAGLGAFSFTDSATPGVVIKAVHITQLRTAVDQAAAVFGFFTGGWTDSSLTGVAVKAVHFQEIRDRMK